MQSLSIICFVHNLIATGRMCFRVNNFLLSLRAQIKPPLIPKIIIFNWSNDSSFDKINNYCKKYNAIHMYKKFKGNIWNKPAAINTAARIFPSKYIMGTDIDYIFQSNFLSVVEHRSNNKKILLSHVYKIPYFISSFELKKYGELKRQSNYRWQNGSNGAAQIVSSEWFFINKGYDEEMEMWGGMDNEFSQRAVLTGLERDWIDNETSILHQYHDSGKSLSNPIFMREGNKCKQKNKRILKQRRKKVNMKEWGKLSPDIINDFSINSC
jgi:hypothetical protein